MAARKLSMRKIREILRLKYEVGLSHRAIARALTVGVGSVSAYAERARLAGLSWPLPEELDDAALESRLFSTRHGPPGPRPQPDVAHIHQELKRVGVTLHLLWMEYLEIHPEGYRYSQFCEIYRRWQKKLHPAMRQRHRAGDVSMKRVRCLLQYFELSVNFCLQGVAVRAVVREFQLDYDAVVSYVDIRIAQAIGGGPGLP